MPVKEPAHPLEKRDLLHAENPKRDRIVKIASKLIAEGRHPEAIEYLEIAHEPAQLDALESEALARGSTFLLQAVGRLRSEDPDPAQFVQIAEVAQSKERWVDAVRALTLAGREDEAEALRVERCPDYEPFKPQGK